MSEPTIRNEDAMGVSIELKNKAAAILIDKQDYEGLNVWICKLVDGQIIIPFGAITEQSDVYIVPIETIAELRGGRYNGPKVDAFISQKDQPLILREYARMVKNYAHDFLSGDFSEWEYVQSEYKKGIEESEVEWRSKGFLRQLWDIFGWKEAVEDWRSKGYPRPVWNIIQFLLMLCIFIFVLVFILSAFIIMIPSRLFRKGIK
ncbi:MAG TPA: hypothetical protein VNK96_09740 [Fimbriimonadales bacterium]|nr:hypothetical protein [Fimbriimonadales bacterium]